MAEFADKLNANLPGALKVELAALRAEVERLKAELAVRERQAEILDEEWDGRHTVESALAQARDELAKEAKP